MDVGKSLGYLVVAGRHLFCYHGSFSNVQRHGRGWSFIISICRHQASIPKFVRIFDCSDKYLIQSNNNIMVAMTKDQILASIAVAAATLALIILTLTSDDGTPHPSISLSLRTGTGSRRLQTAVTPSLVIDPKTVTPRIPLPTAPFTNHTHKLPPKILHVLWGRPLSTIDRTFAGKERTFDEDSFTGCCDQLVELALKSYVENLPKGYSVYFWNIGGWDSVGFLRHIGLYTDNDDDDDESVTIKPMEFDPQIEMAADEPQLINIYQQLQAVVPRGDFVRYYVMKKYGGSYVDLDGVLVRPIPYKVGIPMMNLSPTSQTNLDLLSCTGRGYVRQPGACILSNGLFVGFPADHAIFHIIMMTIKKETRTCGGKSYFCYGPQWMTRVILNEGIRNMADLGIEVGPFLRNGGSYKHESEVFIAHLALGTGNSKMVGNSLCHASAVLSEFCQKFNVTERSRDTSSTTVDNR